MNIDKKIVKNMPVIFMRRNITYLLNLKLIVNYILQTSGLNFNGQCYCKIGEFINF
jgi:hypothetical protein